MMDSDKLLYENANTYRLHADNLRWTLLGGYIAFFTAACTILQFSCESLSEVPSVMSFGLFAVSYLFLWILAVQNWFYNLFAQYVDECEFRLVKKIGLRPLHAYAQSNGCYVNPYHPAFYLAEAIVGIGGFFFLVIAIINLALSPQCRAIFDIIPQGTKALLWIYLIAIYCYIPNYAFLHWNRVVYIPIICHLSNLYKPLVK